MTDTPDFDKMSPEEIMKWMESLAKRQGATEGMTTSADMDVGNVSEDDERLKGQQEYIPFGMKKEDWEKQKAREEEQKRQRLAAQPPAAAKPVPPPVQAPPPPPPVQAAPPPPQPAPAAAVSDTPDFDNMSPEEIMKWMESLAKRQGVTEGLTTSADMEVGSVSEDDERLKGQGQYTPGTMSTEAGKKWLEQEEEKKRQRAAQQPPAAARPAAPLQPPPAAFQPPAAEIQPPAALNDFLSGDLPSLDMEEDETVAARGGQNPVNWLSNVADEADDSFNFDLLNDTSDPLAALEQLGSNNDLDLSDMSWLTDIGGADTGLDALADLANLNATAQTNDPLDFLNSLAEPATPARPASSGPQPGQDSLEWLESMARDHGATDEELITPANLNVQRPKDARPDGPGYTPYSFETASDSLSEEPVAVPNDFDFGAGVEDASEDWLDEVARNVATDGHPAKPTSRTPEAAPQGDVVEDVMSRLNSAKEVDPEEINRMFETLFERAEQYADRDVSFDDPVDSPAAVPDDIPGEALKAEIPDWLRDQMISSTPAETSSDAAKMDDLMRMFDEEPMPDTFNAQSAAPVSEMPDWLRETPDDDVPAVGGDLPDWLQATEGEDDANIFAEQNSAMPWETALTDDDAMLGQEIVDEDDLGELIEDEEPERSFTMELDTSDRWVEALTLEEEAEDQLAQWYAEKTGLASQEDMADVLAQAAPMAAAAAQPVVLKAAQLPVEAVLVLGETQIAPDWLLGGAAMPAAASYAAPTPAAVTLSNGSDDDDIPDWLRDQTDVPAATSDLDDIPDWLRDQVDDSVGADASDLPPWLANEDIAVETESGDLPDWLRETMAEEDAAPVASFAPSDSAPTVVMVVPVVPDPTPVQPSVVPPAAIQPVKTSPAPMVSVNIDVASTLQAARGKVSSGDVSGSLNDYEMIVRANTALDEVVKDLAKLTEHKEHKKNPAVYRVLGDTLMRRGDLKAALDTYRKALHML